MITGKINGAESSNLIRAILVFVLSRLAASSLAVRDDNFRQHGIVLVVQGNEPQSVFKRGRRKDRVDQSGAVTRPEVTPKQTSLYRRFGIYRDLVEDRKQLGQLIFFLFRPARPRAVLRPSTLTPPWAEFPPP